MTALFAHETEFWIEFSLCLRREFELFHPETMDAGAELNIVDGKFFPPICVAD